MVWASSAARFAQLLWLQRTRRCLCLMRKVEQETLVPSWGRHRFSFFIWHFKKRSCNCNILDFKQCGLFDQLWLLIPPLHHQASSNRARVRVSGTPRYIWFFCESVIHLRNTVWITFLLVQKCFDNCNSVEFLLLFYHFQCFVLLLLLLLLLLW